MITKYRTLPEVEPTGQRGCLAVRPPAVVEMGGGHIVSPLGATARFKCNISERVLCISSDLYTGIQTRALNLIVATKLENWLFDVTGENSSKAKW